MDFWIFVGWLVWAGGNLRVLGPKVEFMKSFLLNFSGLLKNKCFLRWINICSKNQNLCQQKTLISKKPNFLFQPQQSKLFSYKITFTPLIKSRFHSFCNTFIHFKIIRNENKKNPNRNEIQINVNVNTLFMNESSVKFSYFINFIYKENEREKIFFSIQFILQMSDKITW